MVLLGRNETLSAGIRHSSPVTEMPGCAGIASMAETIQHTGANLSLATDMIAVGGFS